MTSQLQALLLLASLTLLFLSGFGSLLLVRSARNGSPPEPRPEPEAKPAKSGKAAKLAKSVARFSVARPNARFSKEGPWLVWSGFMLFACDLIFNCRELFRDGGRAITWSHGWMLPEAEIGALTVGISVDPISLLFSLFILVASILFIVNQRPGGLIHGALAITASGSALAFYATTPWLSFLGIAVATLGGFIALCSDRGTSEGAELASQFGWQRFSGLVLAMLGAGALAGTRSALVTGGLGVEDMPAWNLSSNAEILAAWLLALGLLLQFHGFPLLGWTMSRAGVRIVERVFLTLILPGAAALGFLLKLEPELRGTELVPWLAWVAIGSAVLTILSGLMSPRRESALLAWVSAGFSLSVAAALRAGPAAGVALAVCTALPAFSLSLLLDSPSKQPIVRIGAWLAAGAGVGLIGFVSAGGWFDWIARDNFVAAVLFLHSLLAWSLVWEGVVRAGTDEAGRSPWVSGISAVFVALLSSGLLWMGSLSGGVIQGEEDQVAASLSRLAFALPAEADLSTVNLVFGLTFVAGLAISIWLPFERLRKSMPGAQFIAQGYRLDAAGLRIRAFFGAIGRLATLFAEERVWKTYLPDGLLIAFGSLARAVLKLSEAIYRGLAVAVDRGVAGPSRVLQLVQSGDVQWYLFFAVGSGLLLLLHFLRT
jgi:hypothetical protein